MFVLYLGDLGYIGDGGNLHFVSRIKSLIKYKGKHVHPVEIENIIMEKTEVADVAVFGMPDPLSAELVAAAIVLEKDFVENETEFCDDILEFVNARVKDHKKIRGGIFVVDKIPRNHPGKVVRRELIKVFSLAKY